jgi:hypothetical protein
MRADGTKSTCPTTGIKYLPKSGTASPTTTGSGSTPTATGTPGTFSGSGYLQAYTSGSNTGCLISAGTWVCKFLMLKTFLAARCNLIHTLGAIPQVQHPALCLYFCFVYHSARANFKFVNSMLVVHAQLILPQLQVNPHFQEYPHSMLINCFKVLDSPLLPARVAAVSPAAL